MQNYTDIALNEYSTLYPILDDSVPRQITILIVIYSLCVCFGIIGLGVRIKRKTIWLFKLKREDGNTHLIPHTAVFFILMKTVFAICCTLALFKMRSVYLLHQKQRNILAWRITIWIPLLIGAYLESWGLLTVAKVGSAPTKSFQTLTYHQKIFSPLVINLIMSLTPVIACLTLLPPLLLANRHYNSMLESFKSLQYYLYQAAATDSDTLSLDDIIGDLEQTFEHERSIATRLAHAGFVLYLFWLILFVSVFLLAARNVYIQLSRQLNALRTSISALELQDEDKVSNSRIESAKIRIDQIKEAIIILSVQAVVYFGCTLAFAAVAIAELMKPLAVESQYFTFFNLGAFWAYAIGGTPGIFFAMLTGFTVQNGGFIGNVSQSTTTSHSHTETGLKSTSPEETDEDEISPEMLRQLGLTSFVKQKPALPTPSISDSFTSANTIADTPMNTILLLRSNSRSSWGHGILQRSPSTSPSFLSTQQQGSAPPSSAGSDDPLLDINLVEKNGSRMNRVKKGNWKPSVWIKEEEEV